MNDLLKIAIHEREPLMRGWVVSTLLVLPFTYVPTLLQHGWSLAALVERTPNAIFYSLGFSLVVVIAALLYNYESLWARKRVFHKPAFHELYFRWRLDGVGSIIDELEFFLLGKIGRYYFRINLIEYEGAEKEIAILPLIDDDLTDELKEKLGYTRYLRISKLGYFVGKQVYLTDKELEDPLAVKIILENMSEELEALGVTPEQVIEWELNSD